MSNLKKPHIYTYRVRYADTDQMSVVYHARYLEWFEAARTEMLRAAGLPYKVLEDAGFSLPVLEAHCQYKQPALYDDLIEVTTKVGEWSRLRFTLNYGVRRQGEEAILAEGFTKHCFVDKNGRPVRVEKKYQEVFETL